MISTQQMKKKQQCVYEPKRSFWLPRHVQFGLIGFARYDSSSLILR